MDEIVGHFVQGGIAENAARHCRLMYAKGEMNELAYGDGHGVMGQCETYKSIDLYRHRCCNM